MPFTLGEDTLNLSKITDLFDGSTFPPNILQVFTYIWVWFLGGWFFAGIIGAVGCMLYVKYENWAVSASYFIIMITLYLGVLQATPVGGMPSAESFIFFIGVFVSIGIGFLLFFLL